MLEGLEISEISYKKIIYQNRYDSEYFQKRYLLFEQLIKNKGFKQIQDCFKVTDGEHGSVNFVDEGVKYLTAENIKRGYVDLSNIRFVDKEVDNRNARARVAVDDILISIKGTLGQIAIADKWLLPANMNRDVAIIKPLKGFSSISKVIAIFLMSEYGEIQSLRGGSGGVQQMITLERLRQFFIPDFASIFIERISELYEMSINTLAESQNIYTQAEQLLLEELGLKDWQPSVENINEKTFKESFLSTGRLDAEYYQPKYEDYYNIITSYKKGCTYVNKEFEHITYTSTKNKDGYYYIEIGDVNVGDGNCQANFVEIKELPANAKTVAQKGDILISNVRPNRGAVSIIDIDYQDLIVSGAFTVLREKSTSTFSNEVLKALLRLGIYKDWLLQFNVGTQYPVIKDEDILNLPIPILDEEIQSKVTFNVRKSQQLKQQSEHLLEVAKRAVEIAIEQDEDAAMEYINKNTIKA